MVHFTTTPRPSLFPSNRHASYSLFKLDSSNLFVCFWSVNDLNWSCTFIIRPFHWVTTWPIFWRAVPWQLRDITTLRCYQGNRADSSCVSLSRWHHRRWRRPCVYKSGGGAGDCGWGGERHAGWCFLQLILVLICSNGTFYDNKEMS